MFYTLVNSLTGETFDISEFEWSIMQTFATLNEDMDSLSNVFSNIVIVSTYLFSCMVKELQLLDSLLVEECGKEKECAR